MNILKSLYILAVFSLLTTDSRAQISLSGGTYSQNFNSLASSSASNTNWLDNSTLSGWYASQKSGGALTNYRVSTGSSTASALYSFGSSSDTERALGSMAGGIPNDFAYGARFTNNTANAVSNITISYVGEQWRRGSTNLQSLTFSYCISGTPITNADPAGSIYSWTPVPSLDFHSPNLGSSAAIDGNDPTNRQVFSGIFLTNAAVLPGQELFLRWLDVDDTGFDHGLAIDDLLVSFASGGGGGGLLPIPLSVQLAGNEIVLAWTNSSFGIQAATQPDGVFTNVPAAVSPYTNAILAPQKYFRLKAN
jgi:hypothetical protein